MYPNYPYGAMPYGATMPGYPMGGAPISPHLAGLPGMPAPHGHMPAPMMPMGQPGALGMPLGMGDTGLTVVDNIVQETLLLDIITGAILTSPIVLYGLGVVVTNFRGMFTQNDLGTRVKVPYWNTIPEFQDLANDGDKLQFYQMRSLAEENVVKHSAIGLEVSDWTSLFTRDGARSQGEFANQARVRWAQLADRVLLNEAMTKAIAADDTVFEENTQARRFLDRYSAASPVYFGREMYIDGLGARGAIGVNEEPALLVMHVDTLTRSMKVNDAIGNPNLIQGGGMATADQMQILVGQQAGPTRRMLVPYNVPVAVTDLAAFKVEDGSNPGKFKYRTMALYPNAMGWWQNPGMTIERERDIQIPADKLAIHMWYVAHLYQRRDMSPRPGVFVWQHN